MNSITSFLKKNPCYVANKEFTPKGIMVSMVGCPQPSAKVFINNWNRENYTKACPHILVDANDGKVYQTLPYCVQGQFADSEMNNQYISVLLCEPSQIKYTGGERYTVVGDKEKALEAVNRVYRSAVDVCAHICEAFGYDAMSQIHSPAEGVNNPKEPNAFWRQLCREEFIPYSMNALKSHVADRLSKPEEASPEPDAIVVNGLLPDTQAASISIGPVCSLPMHTEEEELAKEEVFEYPDEQPKLIDIQIDVPNLRIRKGPGTGAGCEPIGKYTGVGRFQITEIQNGSGSQKGWGKLASGEGWVSLDFVTVIE